MCSKALRGVFGDGETQTSAASLAGVTLVHPVEPFKYPRLVFLGNTDTGVLDRYAVFANSDSYLAAVLCTHSRFESACITYLDIFMLCGKI